MKFTEKNELKIYSIKENESGISMVSLVITIIAMIILTAIVLWNRQNVTDMAIKAAFYNELSQVQSLTDIKKKEKFELKEKDYGFERIKIINPPHDFVSLSSGEMLGCLIDLEYIGAKGATYGTAYKDFDTENEFGIFRKTDIYVWDKTGTVYYVEGFFDGKDYIHRLDGVSTFETPVITSATFLLHESKEKAMISIEAYSRTGAEVKVYVGGELAGYQQGDKYFIEKTKNGTYEVIAVDEYGNKSQTTVEVSGILTHEEAILNPATLPDILSFESGDQYKRFVDLRGTAIDDDDGIIAWAITKKPGIPSTEWNTISKTMDKINVQVTVDEGGMYYFWVKNADNIASSTSKEIIIINIEYDIKYHLEGGEWIDGNPRDTTKTDDETIEITNEIPLKPGYTFKGWAINSGSTVSVYKGGDEYSAEDDLNLYAIWQANTNTPYKVEHYKEDIDGKYVLEETEALEGTTDTNATATAKQYEFFTLNSSHAEQKDSGNITGDGALILKLYYSRDSFRVNISGTHGTQSAVGTFKHGTKVQITDTAERGYKFSRWVVNAGNIVDLNTTASSTTFTMPTANVDIKAEHEIIVYKISYDLNGGIVDGDNPVTYTVEDTIQIKNPTKDGYRFKGWSGTGISEVVKNLVITNSIGDKEFTANYDELFYLTNTKPTPTYNPVKIKVTSIDNVRYKYSIDGGSTWANCSSLSSEDGNYVVNIEIKENCTLKVSALKADNSVEYTKEITISNILKETMANEPVMGEGMTAVYWDGNSEKTADKHTEDMYNYTSLSSSELTNTSSKWANAKTEDGSYWVWIPRFAYKVEYYTDEGRTVLAGSKTNYEKIFISFLNGTSSTQVKYKNGSVAELPAGYTVASAFSSNGKALEGIWISKYEISSTNAKSSLGGGNVLTTNAGNIDEMQMKSIGNVNSWRGISYDTALENSKYMYEKYDSQLIANKEWEAVALLSQSAYGVNVTEMTLNSSYKTKSGMSTTGNQTGVYDMAGGAWEYTQTDATNSGVKLIEYLDYIISSNSSAQNIIGHTVRGASSVSGGSVTNLPVNGGPDSRIGYRVVLHISK